MELNPEHQAILHNNKLLQLLSCTVSLNIAQMQEGLAVYSYVEWT